MPREMRLPNTRPFPLVSTIVVLGCACEPAPADGDTGSTGMTETVGDASTFLPMSADETGITSTSPDGTSEEIVGPAECGNGVLEAGEVEGQA